MRNSKEQISRESNFELLRLISMLFIVIFHFIHYEMNRWFEPINVDTRHLVSAFFTPYCFIAVNCYVLISGYFGIKGKYKSLLNLYIQCAFYSLVIYAITSIFITSNFSFKYFIYGFFPFSHWNGLWFIPSYLVLFLIAPLLNYGVKYLTKSTYISILIALTFIVVYMGFMWNRTDIMVYTLLFIYLYLIGGFCRLHINWDNMNMKKVSIVSMSFYIIFSSILASCLLFLLLHKQNLIQRFIIRYDNPILILSSICFFIFFRSIQIRSKIINWLAISSLSVYLIHENQYVREYIHDVIHKLYFSIDSGIILSCLLLIFAFAIFIFCILIDKLRLPITTPIENLIIKLNIDSFYNKIVSRINRLIP